MKKILRKKRNFFTLTEVLVAMAVFSILMMFMMRFFSGTQKLWSDAEGQNEVYSDARVAMDFISTLLENAVVIDGKLPFMIRKVSAGDPDRIYFCTKSPIKLNIGSNGKMYFTVIFADPVTNELKIGSLADTNTAVFNAMFYTSTINYGNIDSAITSGVGNTVCEVIVNRVTGLEFTAYDNNMAKLALPVTTVPFAVTVKLSMLDSNNFRKWKEMGGSMTEGDTSVSYQFRKQNEREFTRTIYLGDRSYTP